jgi:hypothetical protein
MRFHFNADNSFRPISINNARFNANYSLTIPAWRGEEGIGYCVGLRWRNDRGEGKTYLMYATSPPATYFFSGTQLSLE